MTIEGFCKVYGVSRPTVYRRIKETGIDPSSLRDKHGELTTEAVQMLAGLCDNVRKQVSNSAADSFTASDTAGAGDVSDCSERLNELIRENNALKAQVQNLQAQLDVANGKIMSLLETAAERSEQHAQSMQRIAELQVMAHRPSLWKRLTSAFHKDTTV